MRVRYLLRGEIGGGLELEVIISQHHLGRRVYELSPPRDHAVCFILVCDTHLLLVLPIRQ